MNRFFLIFLLLFPIRICFASNDEDSNHKILFKDIRSGIAHIGLISQESTSENITIEKWLGTGFLVDSKCTFITAKHVLKSIDKERIAIRFQLPSDLSKVRTLKATLLYQDDKKDLAVLKLYEIENRPYNSGNLHKFPVYESNDFSSLVGEEVLIVGYPMLAKDNVDIPIIRSGLISSSEITWASGPMLLLDLLGVPGFSGSPVILAKKGQVVGVVFGPGPTRRAFGFEWATPINKDFYEEVFSKSTNEK